TFAPFHPTTCDGGACLVGNYTSITDGLVTFTDLGGPGLAYLSSTQIRLTNAAIYQVTLPSNVAAFGSNITFNGATLLSVNFTGDGSPSNNPISGSGYFGASVTAPPITAFTYSLTFGTNVDLTNFETGAGSGGGGGSAPESGTLLTIATGLILFGLR